MIFFLDELVSEGAAGWPDNIAVIEAETGNSITYKELAKSVEALSAQILRKGLKKGQRVGILSPNSILFICVYFAISRAGGIAVPFNHTLDSLDIAREAKDCGLSAIYAGKPLKEKAEAIREEVRSIRFIIEDEKKALQTERRVRPKGTDPVSIIYTSGTTRRPLGVMLSHRNLISNNTSIVKYLSLTADDKILSVLPFYYIYGLSLLFSHFLAGGTVIIDNRFMYPSVVLDTINKYRATGFAGVSSHYAILLYKTDFSKRKFPTLRYLMQAGDRMPSHLTKKLTETFSDKKLYIAYGQTEASPRMTYLNPDLVKVKPNSIGRAIPDVKIKVVNIDGKECNVGRKGEIIARGENVMLGYWNNKKETSKTIKKGWLYTGDMAYRDRDGDLFIVGRRKNFIKTGAHRVNPLEIEDVVIENNNIMEAAVVGAGDDILGKRLKLFVLLVPGKKISPNEIIKFCKNRLPPYKVPSEVVILQSMPKNSFGKIDKKELRIR